MITKEQFKSYEDVRARGRYNMFDPRARAMTGLTREQYVEIMETYDELCEKYNDVINEQA